MNQVEDFGQMISQLGMYSVTVLVGIAIHFFIILPGIFFAFSRRNPLKYYYNMLPGEPLHILKFLEVLGYF